MLQLPPGEQLLQTICFENLSDFSHYPLKQNLLIKSSVLFWYFMTCRNMTVEGPTQAQSKSNNPAHVVIKVKIRARNK
ncbi:hypothetical protein Hanom_Chr04g00285081 [Helianthus anomalus]